MNDTPQNRFGRNGSGSGGPIVPKSPSQAFRPEQGTPPPRRSRAARNQFVVFLNFALSTVILVVIAVGIALWFGRQEFFAPGPSATATTFSVPKAAGTSQIAALLARRNLISDERIFSLGVRAFGNDGKLKTGEYEIKAGASMKDIMELLKSGRSILYSLTVPEGWTVDQVMKRIAGNEVLSGDMPAEMPPEGSLIADTQKFERGTSRTELVDRMRKAQEQLVERIWNRREPDLPVKDINEFVTLASIVEKETGVADERPRVAAVFINRLRKGMRLQSDPTIIYGLFGGEGKPADRPIYRSDIDKPTPYNTYVIDGLPPGPIAIPGRAALEAVANPSQTSDLYFVADGTGGHVFSETLDEHNDNVRRWRELKKKEEAEADKAATEAVQGGQEQPAQ
ncbi:4-amino-4-deoxychorismate lyase [Zhengella mangrovi]|uniref:Endolytic murein transglycosylase n=1 Tax=Zhengella mangrovi TaxID=1982044 RepID=A0A2G1QRS9_9HYPH|nr:endolytic transglycosylase MltG [Zhengella mangrovi]PHP68247.1 4-amino-4-deoxychorismate lyase [Zhengella mangrovi]